MRMNRLEATGLTAPHLHTNGSGLISGCTATGRVEFVQPGAIQRGKTGCVAGYVGHKKSPCRKARALLPVSVTLRVSIRLGTSPLSALRQ